MTHEAIKRAVDAALGSLAKEASPVKNIDVITTALLLLSRVAAQYESAEDRDSMIDSLIEDVAGCLGEIKSDKLPTSVLAALNAADPFPDIPDDAFRRA